MPSTLYIMQLMTIINQCQTNAYSMKLAGQSLNKAFSGVPLRYTLQVYPMSSSMNWHSSESLSPGPGKCVW